MKKDNKIARKRNLNSSKKTNSIYFIKKGINLKIGRNTIGNVKHTGDRELRVNLEKKPVLSDIVETTW